ncbi:cyun34 [Cyclophragma undans nucleopolyhedrovirus]|uniref:Cyun34 n=1 Tax=Cyclophragma undans nucleopolyhedrovirus TaxID=1906244 RepID=A0A288QYM4_9ABAC|nr:cyun34 [Cyclophragma undans nucleopolyhedrovirus]AOT85504.1 cyun34 [Cyclophragma undans nucleopolyhedrovirus]
MRQFILVILIVTISSGAMMNSVVKSSLRRDPLQKPSMHVDHPPGLDFLGSIKFHTKPPPNRDEDKLLQCKLIYNVH